MASRLHEGFATIREESNNRDRTRLPPLETAATLRLPVCIPLMTAYLYIYEQFDVNRRRGITLLRKPSDADEILRLVAAGLGNGPASKP